MKHATSESLDQLEPLLTALRALPVRRAALARNETISYVEYVELSATMRSGPHSTTKARSHKPISLAIARR